MRLPVSRLYADGRHEETITYNTKRVIKLKIDGDIVENPAEYFSEIYAPIEAGIKKLVSEHKEKADKIFRNMEGFENAKTFHFSYKSGIAISKSDIVAIFNTEKA